MRSERDKKRGGGDEKRHVPSWEQEDLSRSREADILRRLLRLGSPSGGTYSYCSRNKEKKEKTDSPVYHVSYYRGHESPSECFCVCPGL